MVKILVIEDEPPVLENINQILSFEGFFVIVAKNGLMGLQLAREELPDLILCDIMMPELDGYKVLEELRNDSATATIPFVFLTAKTERRDMRKGMELGADDFITKPFKSTELIAAIQARLEKQALLKTQRLQSLSHRLFEMHEAERARVAHELHNEISDMLTGLKVLLGMGRRRSREDGYTWVDEAQILVDELITRVDEVANDLHPMMLNELGLLSTLLQFFKRYTEQTQVHVHFRHAGLQQRFHPELETTVYRIVHEALANVAFHSGAPEVSVDIWLDQDVLNVHIVDSGSGFQVNQVIRSTHIGGLTNLQDRVSLLDGLITIVSTPGEGTQITAHLPVKEGEIYTPFRRQINPEMEAARTFGRPLSREVPRSVSPTTTLVGLVSSNALIRQGLRRMLETETQFSIVAEVAHANDTIDMVTRFQPNVVILDWEIGLDTIEPLIQLSPQTYVLILSRFADEAYVIEALRQGAMGYVLRDLSTEELVQAIAQVATGRRYLSPKFSERAIASYINEQSAEESSLDELGVLTSREQEIFHLVIEGYKNTEIADQLVISPRTVETHRANMMRKLGLHSQTDLIRYAAQRGFIARDS